MACTELGRRGSAAVLVNPRTTRLAVCGHDGGLMRVVAWRFSPTFFLPLWFTNLDHFIT